MGELNAEFVNIVNHLICSIESKEKPFFQLQNPKSQIFSIYSLNTELFDPQHQIIKSR